MPRTPDTNRPGMILFYCTLIFWPIFGLLLRDFPTGLFFGFLIGMIFRGFYTLFTRYLPRLAKLRRLK